MNNGEAFGALLGCGFFGILGLMALAFYFIPTIIALARHHQQAGMIIILNIFLGWTFIGWVVSLATAFSHTAQKGRMES